MTQTLSADEYRAMVLDKGKQAPKICAGCGRAKQACECLPLALLQQIAAVGLPEPVREFRFHRTRKWRFDVAYPDHFIAIECEGGIYSGNGAHVRVKHFEQDCEKYAEAAILGWRVLRCSGDQVRGGQCVSWLERVLKGQGDGDDTAALVLSDVRAVARLPATRRRTQAVARGGGAD